MFGLFVSDHIAERSDGDFYLDVDRFLEYTATSLEGRLKTLNLDATRCLQSWPCILMQEGRLQERAYVRQLTKIRQVGRTVALSFGKVEPHPNLINDDIWKNREALGVLEFEFNRHHFAIKDSDLFGTLTIAGQVVEPALISKFREVPPPIVERDSLLNLIDPIAALSHTQIDRLLVDAGLSDLTELTWNKNRDKRAQTIVQYAFDHPFAVTAGNRLLSSLLVEKVVPSPSDDHRSRALSIESSPLSALPQDHTADPIPLPDGVFVVHGRDEAARIQVVDVLGKLGLKSIVLHEKPNKGRHLLTKFFDEAKPANFAVVLMTGDDQGGIIDGPLKPRARQNVILELGYFLSHLGQPRVCALVSPGVERPSDFEGIVYVEMDAAGKWKAVLERELQAANLPVKPSP